MKLFRCLAAAAALNFIYCCCAAQLLPPAKSEPTVYIVKKGDTLWGLSDRFMKDPYYWPDLWARNPQRIVNPHFIYPGQKLRIYPDRIEVETVKEACRPAEKTAEAPKAATAAPLRLLSTMSRLWKSAVLR